MTNTNFNTTNSTFRQLLGNGLIYCVPPFQRDYSWGEDEWDDLWQDMLALFAADGDSSHYLGYLVLQSADSKKFDIIDGQQRITTLSVLILSAIACINEMASHMQNADDADRERRRAEQLRSSYIGYLNPVTLVTQPKLHLNRHNDHFYGTYLVPLDTIPQRGIHRSEHLLRKVFYWFKERLTQRYKNGTEITSWVETIVDRLFFTVITVTDELHAFTVFETLNSRGVKLSATDLLKNYLFSVITGPSGQDSHSVETNKMEETWEVIVSTLGNEPFPTFLRVYWNSCHPLVRQPNLFKTIRRAVTNREQAFNLLRELDRHARIYTVLRQPDDPYWQTDERDALRQLKIFNVRQPFALLLRAWDCWGESDRSAFQHILRAIVIISLRYNVIGGKATHEQEKLYNVIAQDLVNGNITTAKQLIKALHTVYLEDSLFERAFADKILRTIDTRNKKVVSYLLCEIEKQMTQGKSRLDPNQYSIEHIMPQSATDEWEAIADSHYDHYLYRLGNMTLLDASSNRSLANHSFADKRDVYQRSKLAITQSIADRFQQWDAQAIQQRQQWMAKQAKAIWHIDFGDG